MPRVPCQVVRGGQHRRTQLGLCCSQVITRHVCQLSEVASDVYAPPSAPSQRPWQRRNDIAIASPHTPQHHHHHHHRHYTMPQKGSNYRMDGRLLYKCKAADRPGRACWCQVSNKYQQDRVTAELPRVDSVRNTDAFQHQKEAKKQEKKQRLLTFFFGGCGVAVMEFQMIKSELWSDWNMIPVMTNNPALVSPRKLQSCLKLLSVAFQNMRSYSCVKHISPKCAELCIVTQSSVGEKGGDRQTH